MQERQRNYLVGRPDEFQVRKMLSAIRCGDRSALSKLYMSYYACLADFVSQFVEADRLEDVIIDTFLTIWETARDIPFEAKLSVWLFHIAHRHAVKFGRCRIDRASAHRNRVFEGRPSESGTQVQTLRTLSGALQCLPAEQRVVLTLCYKMGFSVREIAFITESQDEAVKLQMSQARANCGGDLTTSRR
jgi:RNA polymerase sigma factor (sigma-70 family)